jgi:hypothetical protein
MRTKLTRLPKTRLLLSNSTTVVSGVVFSALIVLFSPAVVTSQNITVNNNLVFGNIFPGIPKTVSKRIAGGAAEFLISGTAGLEMTIDLTLPTFMNSAGSNMQLVFTETDAALDSSATADQSNPSLDNIDPWHTITYRLGSNGITLWLGGMAIPKLSQVSGSYTAVIVMTVVYTGN